eukprot:750608-Hanusia_phi.AAC.3
MHRLMRLSAGVRGVGGRGGGAGSGRGGGGGGGWKKASLSGGQKDWSKASRSLHPRPPWSPAFPWKNGQDKHLSGMAETQAGAKNSKRWGGFWIGILGGGVYLIQQTANCENRDEKVRGDFEELVG